MTGVQTCALPICFPVTIPWGNIAADIRINPAVLNPIFGVAVDSTWDTDQLLINSYIGCYVARNLSRDGVPY